MSGMQDAEVTKSLSFLVLFDGYIYDQQNDVIQ